MFSVRPHYFRNLLFLLFSLTFYSCLPQSYFFGDGPVKWDIRKLYEIPSGAEKYKACDLVILSDLTEIDFCSSVSEKITRNIKYKINTQKGLEDLKHYEMPESFDYGFDSELYKQGRRSRIKIPYVRGYSIKVFAARKFSRQRWSNVNVKDSYETKRWIKNTGEFLDEDNMVFNLGTIAIGDVVEIYYEVYFDSQYGANIFYFNGAYPKLTCEYDFVYRWDEAIKDASFILPVNIEEAGIYSSKVTYPGYSLVTAKIQRSDLNANNYPLNSFVSHSLPHVYADFAYYRSLLKYVDKEYHFSKSARSKSYEWMVKIDTGFKQPVKVYDKQLTAIRKFVASLPPAGSDSENVVFMRSLCDTFNNFRYISANHLYYNESNLYELYSSDHLLKRRLTSHTLTKLYADILKENKVFYYQANIQDKRFGDHDLKRRIYFGYEHSFMAFPLSTSYTFFVPRNEGLKYHPGELPFYYEDAFVTLIPVNIYCAKDKETKSFKTIKTPSSTFKENMRIENVTIRMDIDSLLAYMVIKESLSGQFSTILRPLYLNDFIDSTITPYYFRKCLDKPNTSAKKIKLSSKQVEAPFCYTFDCSAKMNIKDSSKLSLKNWFSFLFSKKVIPEALNNNYYFDFESSDLYNLQLNFKRRVEIKNERDFTRKINNDYFELESEIVKSSERIYTLKVAITVKQKVIPQDKSSLLMEMVENLDQINDFTLELARD